MDSLQHRRDRNRSVLCVLCVYACVCVLCVVCVVCVCICVCVVCVYVCVCRERGKGEKECEGIKNTSIHYLYTEYRHSMTCVLHSNSYM